MQEFELLGYVYYRDAKDNTWKFLVTLGRQATPEEEKNNRIGMVVMKQYLDPKQFNNYNPNCIGRKYYLSTGISPSGQTEILGLVEVGSIL